MFAYAILEIEDFLPRQAGKVGRRLRTFWLQYCGCFKTDTPDTSARAYDYLRGQLTMDARPNSANTDGALSGADSQTMRCFISNVNACRDLA